MNILRAIIFQLKCLFLGLSTDVKNIADERAVMVGTLNMDDIAPEVGRGRGLGASKVFIDSH